MYINLLTDAYIPDEAVVRVDDRGLTFYMDGSWKFLGRGEYREVSEHGGFSEQVPVIVLDNGVDKVIDASPERKTQKERFYVDYFGLNNLTLANMNFLPVSGMVSGKIPVKMGTPLRLRGYVQLDDPEKASVEFSILESGEETPILLAGQKKVEHEKVFFGMPARFRTRKASYYTDGIPAGGSLPTDAFAEGKNCTVSYTPVGGGTYTPSTGSVRIKTVIRMYDGSAKAPEITGLRLEECFSVSRTIKGDGTAWQAQS